MDTFLSDQLLNKRQLNLQKLKEEKTRIAKKRKRLYSEFDSSKNTKAAAFDFLRELEAKETQVDGKLKELENIDLDECTIKKMNTLFEECSKLLSVEKEENFEDKGNNYSSLREARKESRYSAKEVARLNHINPGVYRQMETQSSAKEQGECMQVNRRRLCEFFGKTWGELFPGISQDVRHISDYLHPKSGYHSNGSAMAERRVELGYTQKSLAEKLGKSKGTINQIENGKFRPSEKLVKSIAETLCSDVKTLFPDYYKNVEPDKKSKKSQKKVVKSGEPKKDSKKKTKKKPKKSSDKNPKKSQKKSKK